MASAARIMSGHGSGVGLGRTTSASQSGTTAAHTSAARVLISSGLPSPHHFPYPERRWCLTRSARPSQADGPWQSTRMDDSRYLECLSSDYTSLRNAAAAAALTDPVPCCQ